MSSNSTSEPMAYNMRPHALRHHNKIGWQNGKIGTYWKQLEHSCLQIMLPDSIGLALYVQQYIS